MCELSPDFVYKIGWLSQAARSLSDMLCTGAIKSVMDPPVTYGRTSGPLIL
jgi:hypothetical protein